MDYYSLKWIFFILLPELTQSLIKTLPGVTFEQLNGKGKMWIGPPIPPPFCFPPPQMPRALAVPEAKQTPTSAPSGKAPEQSQSAQAPILLPQSPSAAVPVMSYPFQGKTWWCPSMYQQQTPMPPLQYPQIPQYPQYPQTVQLPLPPQYQQIIQPPLPQYQQSLPQYQQIAQLSPQYPQQPINGAGMVGSSLYGMIGEDSDSTLKVYDQFQMIFT